MSEIYVKENESLDNALKRFKRSCAKDGVMRDLSDTASGEVLFLPKYDAYYNFTSDAGLGGFTAVSGTVEGDTVRLTSAGGDVLTLRAVPSEAGRYFIVSFLQG